MKLTSIERETIIVFNEAENNAVIETCNNSLMRQLDDFSKKSPSITCTKTTEVSKEYNLPKKWIKVRMPRIIDEEKRKALSERAKKNFSKQ